MKIDNDFDTVKKIGKDSIQGLNWVSVGGLVWDGVWEAVWDSIGDIICDLAENLINRKFNENK